MTVDAADMNRNEVEVVLGVVVDHTAGSEAGKVESADTMGYSLDYSVQALEPVRIVVVAAHIPAESDNDLPPVKPQGSSADYSPAEVDNQVVSDGAVMVIDHQGK